MDDYLGVAAGAKLMAQRGEFLHQALKVVDLAVEDDADAVVLVVHGLVASGEVDDGKSAMGQPDTWLDMQAGTVGSPVLQPVVHGRQ